MVGELFIALEEKHVFFHPGIPSTVQIVVSVLQPHDVPGMGNAPGFPRHHPHPQAGIHCHPVKQAGITLAHGSPFHERIVRCVFPHSAVTQRSPIVLHMSADIIIDGFDLAVCRLIFYAQGGQDALDLRRHPSFLLLGRIIAHHICDHIFARAIPIPHDAGCVSAQMVADIIPLVPRGAFAHGQCLLKERGGQFLGVHIARLHVYADHAFPLHHLPAYGRRGFCLR